MPQSQAFKGCEMNCITSMKLKCSETEIKGSETSKVDEVRMWQTFPTFNYPPNQLFSGCLIT